MSRTVEKRMFDILGVDTAPWYVFKTLKSTVVRGNKIISVSLLNYLGE